MKIDNKYVSILQDILINGEDYEDPNRKGVIRKELPFVSLKHSVEQGYPAITVRKSFFKGAVGELLLFLKGSTDIRDYWRYGIEFWNDDYARYQGMTSDELNITKELLELGDWKTSEEIFSMGKIYPYQYKKQHHIFDNFKENKLRSDLIVDSWQVEDLKNMCLIPCHYSYQLVGSESGFYVVWTQRSTDLLLGSPINTQFYYLMGMLLEFWSGHKFKGIIGNLSKVHLYDNGFELAKKLCKVNPGEYKNGIEVELNLDESLKELTFSEFIKQIEPKNFAIKNYDYIIDEKVPMLTYNK